MRVTSVPCAQVAQDRVTACGGGRKKKSEEKQRRGCNGEVAMVTSCSARYKTIGTKCEEIACRDDWSPVLTKTDQL